MQEKNSKDLNELLSENQKDSKPEPIVCPRCNGEGCFTYYTVRKIDIPCSECNGTGMIFDIE